MIYNSAIRPLAKSPDLASWAEILWCLCPGERRGRFRLRLAPGVRQLDVGGDAKASLRWICALDLSGGPCHGQPVGGG